MSYIYSVIFFISAFFIQVSLLGNMRVFGVIPDILLISIVMFSYFKEPRYVFPLIILMGFLMDIYFSSWFGAHIIFFSILMWLSHILSAEGRVVSLTRILVLVSTGSLLQSLYSIGLLRFSDVELNLIVILNIFSQIGINCLFTFITFNYFTKFFDFLGRTESISKQKIKV